MTNATGRSVDVQSFVGLDFKVIINDHLANMQAFHFTKRLCRLIQQIKVICAINVNYFLYCLFLLCFYLPFWIISIL